MAISTSHILSNILIYLKPGEGFTDSEFAAATKTVKLGNVKTSATVNLNAGSVTAKGDDSVLLLLKLSGNGRFLTNSAEFLGRFSYLRRCINHCSHGKRNYNRKKSGEGTPRTDISIQKVRIRSSIWQTTGR